MILSNLNTAADRNQQEKVQRNRTLRALVRYSIRRDERSEGEAAKIGLTCVAKPVPLSTLHRCVEHADENDITRVLIRTEARISREGSDVTIVAWGQISCEAIKAGELLAAEGGPGPKASCTRIAPP